MTADTSDSVLLSSSTSLTALRLEIETSLHISPCTRALLQVTVLVLCLFSHSNTLPSNHSVQWSHCTQPCGKKPTVYSLTLTLDVNVWLRVIAVTFVTWSSVVTPGQLQISRCHISDLGDRGLCQSEGMFQTLSYSPCFSVNTALPAGWQLWTQYMRKNQLRQKRYQRRLFD